jgi:uncharacterized protein YcnI
MPRLLTVATLATIGTLSTTGIAVAHAEPDYIAVPAGFEAAINLKPTHGCDGSPTVAVRVRSPLPATAGEVEGWTASTTPGRGGRTILEWSGGVLPSDQEGAFPLEFLVPDAPGDLLVFPAVQRCENGEELAWLSGDPAAEYPAPRVLILPAGSEPALTIDEVPPDAPGREKLTAVVDVDQPNAPPITRPPATAAPPATATPTTPTPTSVAPTTAAPTTSVGTTSTTPATAPPSTSAPPSATPATVPVATAPDEDGGSNSSGGPIVAVAAIAAAGAAVAYGVRRRRANG